MDLLSWTVDRTTPTALHVLLTDLVPAERGSFEESEEGGSKVWGWGAGNYQITSASDEHT